MNQFNFQLQTYEDFVDSVKLAAKSKLTSLEKIENLTGFVHCELFLGMKYVDLLTEQHEFCFNVTLQSLQR